MIHIYCGDGKGKTTAATGLAFRMAGSGGRVHIIQFLKGSQSGEIDFLRDTKITISRLDKDYGFYKNMTDEDKTEVRKRHNDSLRHAKSQLSVLDMLVLDEVFAAISCGLVDTDLVKDIIENNMNTEIVLTGRNPDKYFLEKADYVSEIKKVKHPFDRGVSARRGIEY